MKRPRFLRQKEVDIKLRHEHAERPRKLVPWWARALRRIGMRQGLRRQQPGGSLSGARAARVADRGAARHMRGAAWSRPRSRATAEAARGRHMRAICRAAGRAAGIWRRVLGFDADREDIDMLAHGQRLGEERRTHVALHRFARGRRSPQSSRPRARSGRPDGTRPRHKARMGRDRSSQHRRRACSSASSRCARQRPSPWRSTASICARACASEARRSRRGSWVRGWSPRCCRSRERAVRREQWTEIDRSLQRKADANGLVTYDQFQPRSDGARIRAEQEVDRLQFLSGLGLASRVDERSWQLAQNHERELRERQVSERRDQEPRAQPSARNRLRTWIGFVNAGGSAMAEQRPYRVPGFSTDARLARAKRLALLSLAGAFHRDQLGDDAACGERACDASWLGHPLFHLRGAAVYAPWSWIVWWTRWYWAPQLKPLWDECAREALYPMAVVTAVCCSAIAMVRHGWFANISDLHGSARWATTRDLRAARLIDRAGRCANAARNRRDGSDSEPGPPRRNLSRRLAAMGTSLVHPRLWSRSCSGLRANAQRQGRRHRGSNVAQLAALGPGSRS